MNGGAAIDRSYIDVLFLFLHLGFNLLEAPWQSLCVEGCPIISGDCSTQPGDIQTRETNLFSLLLLELRTPMECCVLDESRI